MNNSLKGITKRTVILVLAAVILTLSAYYAVSKETATQGEAAGASLALFLIALFVGFLSFASSFIDIGAAGKGRRIRPILFMLSIPVIGVGALMAGYLLFIPDINSDATGESLAKRDSITGNASNTIQDPEVKSLLESIGAKGNYSDLNMRWSNTDMVSECGWAEAAGCLKYNEHSYELILDKNNDRNYLRTMVAHEYLHYMWHKEDLDSDGKLTSQLINLYAKHPAFQNRISNHYTDNGALNPNEFFSYGCTEISDAKLGTYIAEKCNKYIDTSSLSIMY